MPSLTASSGIVWGYAKFIGFTHVGIGVTENSAPYKSKGKNSRNRCNQTKDRFKNGSLSRRIKHFNDSNQDKIKNGEIAHIVIRPAELTNRDRVSAS